MADENEQLDEIVALQSIYEDGTFICNFSDKPITGSISITIETNAEEHNFICNGDLMTIKHFTPLILNFSLPSNYPSVSPPDVTLSCLWLTSQQLEKLSLILREKWAESCGVVLFTWIEFLKAEVFELLGIKFPIDISKDKIMKLKEHSALREEEIFNRDIHSCPVCFLEKPGLHCIRMPFCNHIFCKECLSGFLSVYIQEGTMHSLVCPSKDCNERVNPHIIKSLVSHSDFERYDRLLLQNTLDIMSDIGYCPRIKCQKPVIVDQNDGMGYCHACNFAFCTRCNMTYHGIDGCMRERDRVQKSFRMALKAEETKSPSFTTDVVVPERKFKRSSVSQDQRMEKWLNSFSKPCPGCRVNVEKVSGCNLMKCSRCGCDFCWNCLEMKTLGPDGRYTWPNDHGLHGCYRKLSKKEIKVIKEEIKKNNNKEPKDNLEAHETNLVTTDLSNGQSHVDQSISYSKITEHSNLDQTTSVARANNLSPRNLEVDDISDKFEMLGQEDQENQTDLWINSNTKKCPKCSISIEKWMGCNMMSCSKCGCSFCWLCLQKVKGKIGMDHFNIPSLPCFRKMYSRVWNQNKVAQP